MLQTLSALAHPQIDPVLISIGPLQVHWYGIAYAVGILFGWWYAKKMITAPILWGENGSPITEEHLDDFLVWAVIGIILGGRLGYILFYDLPTYIENPLAIFAVWQGGMSFHGGLAGITIAMIVFAKRNGFSPFSLFDVIAACCGLGILLGRVSNFINAELYGRVTDAPWGVIFPGTDGLPRHPSQLYEGFLEGALLLLIMAILIWKFHKLKTPGFIAGVFVAGYGLSRILVEFVRIPDPQLGYLLGTSWITMGMMLSLPLLAIGFWSMATSRSRIPNA
ncbi:MAG: prolipoprotein diacylglyceryl transferase [Rhizobiaceae bacterium]|nr:prolipoprotein diacylglyceryl transferase [Rhizobiaceae bacterium]